MKLSIITPTNNVKYLSELEDSIKANQYTNWEWIILLNGGAKYASTDERIKVYESENTNGFVGALKKEACSYATGEVIVEVDHDDLITPDCLQEVKQAFEDPKIGFVYSDNAKLGKFKPYNPFYGWTWRLFNWKGKDLIAMHSLPLTPARIGHIWYAPDHVRAWRKEVYDFVGGHNKDLEVCDDLDLLHRTYQATLFKHIPKVLYIYRIHGKNAWLEKNKKIQEMSGQMFDKNIMELSKTFSAKSGLMNIDLCGGFNKPKGFISIDKFDGDIIADLDEGIPLQDNSCGIVRAFDALEHLKDKQKTMREIHRVLAPGGVLISRTPSTDGRGAWQDPTHVSFWNENAFWYWTRPQQMQFIRNKDIRFFESKLQTIFPSKWHKQNNIPYVEAILEKI